MVRVTRAIAAGARAIWDTFGGANFLLNTMAFCVVLCSTLLMWWVVLEPIVPLRSADVVMVAPEDRVIDRERSDDFTVMRRVCMSKGGWGTVSRFFVGQDGGGIEFRLVPSPPIFLPAGCHERSRTMEIPATLPPGRYIYRSKIEFCNKVRCEDAWVQDVPLSITGTWPPAEPNGAPGPIRDPL